MPSGSGIKDSGIKLTDLIGVYGGGITKVSDIAIGVPEADIYDSRVPFTC